MKGKRPVYGSLVVCREALQDRREFEEFTNDITLMEEPPDGIYLIVAGRSTEARLDFFHTDVVANWMLLNLALSTNGLPVVNGYSDILAPFLGSAGAFAGASGWFSNLRMFSMDRFSPATGGRAPIIRYLSTVLLNRLMYTEKEAVTKLVPEVVNGLPHDDDYSPEPDRQSEALQSWEALRALNSALVDSSPKAGVAKCRKAVEAAAAAYARIGASGISLDKKSRGDHLDALRDGLDQFEERAGLR
jgi:hypothetical protein